MKKVKPTKEIKYPELKLFESGYRSDGARVTRVLGVSKKYFKNKYNNLNDFKSISEVLPELEKSRKLQ